MTDTGTISILTVHNPSVIERSLISFVLVAAGAWLSCELILKFREINMPKKILPATYSAQANKSLSSMRSQLTTDPRIIGELSHSVDSNMTKEVFLKLQECLQQSQANMSQLGLISQDIERIKNQLNRIEQKLNSPPLPASAPPTAAIYPQLTTGAGSRLSGMY